MLASEGGRHEDHDVVEQDVVVQLQESRNWRLGYGVSWDSEDGFGGLFNVSRSNVGGRAGNVRLDLRANERDQRYRLVYSDRSIGDGALPINYAVFRIDEEISEFESERQGFQIEAQRWFGSLRASAFFDYRDVHLGGGPPGFDPSDPTTLPEIDRDLLDVRIASLTTTALIDRRDDPLDPRRGWSTTLQLQHAFELLDAEERFSKLFVQGSAYLDLGRFGVVAGSLRLGAIEPQLEPGEQAEGAVPISERFFAGGRTSHRAFDRDELGVPGSSVIDGVAVGGNGLVVLNLDYRFPIAGAFGGVAFFDTGNVWGDWRDIDSSDLRDGVGFGVRYLSPIGPIRLEVGYKLDRQDGEDGTVFFASFGNPF